MTARTERRNTAAIPTAQPPAFRGPAVFPPQYDKNSYPMTEADPSYSSTSPSPQLQRPLPEPPMPARPRIPAREEGLPPFTAVEPLGPLPQIGIRPPYGELPGIGRCLGPASMVYATQIESFIYENLTLRQSLRALAETDPQWPAPLLRMAEENLQQARRLAAVYYRLTGLIYWPTTVPGLSSRGIFPVELARLQSITQELETDLREASRTVNDDCLAALYEILADEKTGQGIAMQQILAYY